MAKSWGVFLGSLGVVRYGAKVSCIVVTLLMTSCVPLDIVIAHLSSNQDSSNPATLPRYSLHLRLGV